MLRIDFLFSYWIVLWYILYELSIINFNPIYWLIIALFFNMINMGVMIYYKHYMLLFLFIIVIIIIKVIPIWTLRNTIPTINDFVFGIFLFIIYNFWLLYNNYTFYKAFIIMRNNSKNGTFKNTPLMLFIYNLINKK